MHCFNNHVFQVNHSLLSLSTLLQEPLQNRTVRLSNHLVTAHTHWIWDVPDLVLEVYSHQ